MKSLPIRIRLTLVWTAVMAFVLGAAGLYGYTRLEASLNADLNRELEQRVQDISGPLHRPGNALGALAGEGLIEHGESFAELVDTTGSVVQATPTLRKRSLVTPRQATRASASKTFIDIPQAPGLNEPARLLAVPFTLNGRDMVLVVGATRENGLETLAAVRARMLRAGPILLLVTSLMAYLLAAAALRPVERMRRQATHLNLTASGQRLSVPRTRDEIARLGETLNELLARVEMSVNRERRFVANASHELRTPLALLRTEFDLATRRPRTRAELEAAVASASAEIDRLVSLANDLLVPARESESGLLLAPSDISVPALFARYAGKFSDADPDQRLVTDPGGVSTVRADEARLRQALDNLISNAFEHGSGPTRLTAVRKGYCVEFHVLDDGPGVEEQLRSHEWDRFSHGSRSRGSGLGLAVVEQVALAHGGHAGIRQGQQGGTDAWISLPNGHMD